jgi:putative addiction module component (TIGR02574 family)
MKLADFPEVQALSPKEKLSLVDELWGAIGLHLQNLEVSDHEKALLDSRLAAHQKNPESALTLDQFAGELKKRRQ